jgi:hypothetical protein
MPVRTWTLTDVAAGVHCEPLSLRPGDVGGRAKDYEVTKRTLRGGLTDGVEVIRVTTGDLAYEVLPTRGMGIWKVWLRGEEIGWRSPVRGPVHPQYVPLMEPSGLGWLDGFDELLVRCGLESNGAPDFDAQGRLRYPLHGRIANRPAHHVALSIDGDSGEITVTGVVEEARFHFLKLRLTSSITTQVGGTGLRIRDEVENFSASPAEMQLLYHINFGLPLLDSGARFVAPLRKVVPRNPRAVEGLATWDYYAPEAAGFPEQVYFLELQSAPDGRTQTLLKNAPGTRGVSIHSNVQQLPCYSLWKNTTASPDGYVTGLEPGTNFPNPRTYEGQQGRTVKLSPGGKAAFDLRLDVHPTSAEVAQAEAAIAALQGATQPQIFDQPQPRWCAP